MFKTIDQTIPAWVENAYRDGKHTYQFGIPDFDNAFNNNLRGKCIGLIGTGGAGKSIMGLQVISRNSVGTDTIGVIMNGEMSEGNLLERFFDYQHGSKIVKGSKQASTNIRDKVIGMDDAKARKEYTEILMRQSKSYFGNNVLITDCCDLEKIDKALDNAINKNKKNIVGLVVDSAAMVEHSGTSTEAAEYMSKKLKKLANIYNIAVFVIVHVPKNVPADKRDLSEDGMDSVRIFNNFDAMISFSHCLDEDGNKIDDLKYLLLFNKRGKHDPKNGVYKYIHKICRVNKERIILEETDMNPELFPERNDVESRA